MITSMDGGDVTSISSVRMPLDFNPSMLARRRDVAYTVHPLAANSLRRRTQDGKKNQAQATWAFEEETNRREKRS